MVEELDNDYLKDYLSTLEEQKFPGAKEKTAEEGKLKWLSLADDTKAVVVRILPAWPGAKVPGMMVYKHYGIPGESKSITCYRTWNLECPFCNLLAKYEGQLDLDEWAARGRAFVNALFIKAMNKKKEEDGHKDWKGNVYSKEPVYILGLTEFTFSWLIGELINPEVGNVTDLIQGRNITFQREREKGKFNKSFSFNPTPVAESKEGIELIKSKINDLSKVWRTPDDEYNKAVNVAVGAVAEIIDNRLLMAASVGSTFDTTNQSNQPVSTNVSQSSSENTSASSIISGAPDCFGVKDQYWNEDQNHVNQMKCLGCAYDLQCAAKVKES